MENEVKVDSQCRFPEHLSPIQCEQWLALELFPDSSVEIRTYDLRGRGSYCGQAHLHVQSHLAPNLVTLLIQLGHDGEAPLFLRSHFAHVSGSLVELACLTRISPKPRLQIFVLVPTEVNLS